MEDDKKSNKRRVLRLWINPALLPTRLAQRVREPQPQASRWVKKTEAATEGRDLKLAETAFKGTGNADRQHEKVLQSPLL